MKRFTLLTLSLFVFAGLFAQKQVSEFGKNNPHFYAQQIRSTEDACSESAPSNEFENGYSSNSATDYRVAIDLFVGANDTFSLSQVVLNVFSQADITSVDLYFYDDNAGVPGTEIGSAMGITPTSQDVLGQNFGYDIHHVVLDLATPFDFVAGTDLTKFWVMPVVTDANGVNFVEVTSTTTFGGTPIIRSVDAGGTWEVDENGFEGVYEFNGDCGGVPYIPPTGCVYLQDFEGGTLPSDWTTEVVSGDFDWTFDTNDMPGGADFPNNAATFNDDAAGSGQTNHVILYSPVFNLMDTYSTYAKFSAHVGFQEYGDQIFTVEVFDGTDWQVVATYEEDTDLTVLMVDASNYINENFQVRFVYNDDPDGDGDGSWGWGAGVDDFCMKYDTNPAPPENDCPENAIAIECGDQVTGDTTSATICEAVEDCDEYPNNPTTSPGVWYTIVGTGAETTFSTCNTTDYDTSIGVYTGEPGSLVCMVANDDGTGCAGYSSLLENVMLDDGVTYYVRVYGYSSSSVGTFTMSVECAGGIADNNIEGFEMNPNPVKDVLNLKATDNIENISVYNMLGQKVLEAAPSATSTQIDMSHLNSGAYIVKVQAGDQTGSYNLIKE
jgi:hypothetical protein